MNDMITLLRIAQDMVNEVKDNGSIVRERIYISRELFEDLALEVEKINNEASEVLREKITKDGSFSIEMTEEQADRFLHNKKFPGGREPNY